MLLILRRLRRREFDVDGHVDFEWARRMETIMDDQKPDSQAIANEAVGETRDRPTADAANKVEMPTEDAIRRRAASAGPQADIAVKTAESVGERVGDAYATTAEVRAGSRNVARRTPFQASHTAQQPVVMIAAGFALGYAAALWIHRRQ